MARGDDIRAIAGKRHQDHVGNNQHRYFRRSILNISTTATLAATAAGGLAAARTAIAAENYSTWGRNADLILDTSPSGADVAGRVDNFPILVRLTAANFKFAEARGKGQDIRFSNPDGSPLAYQIERWDSTQALAEVWVKIGTVAGNTAGQAFKMYWGKASAADSSNGPGVFSNYYIAAWHMGGAGSNPRPNSAPNGNAAQPVNYNGEKSREGIIGKADELDGLDDYLDIGDGYQDFNNGLSFSIWANPTAVGKYARFFELGNGENADNIMLTRDSVSNDLRFDNYNPGPTVSTIRSGAAISLNQWQLFAVSVSTGGVVKIYKNGAMIAQGNLSNAFSPNWRASNFLGRSNWAWDAYFQGMLDEPELSGVAHSDNWFKLCYQNQKPAQNLVTIKPPNLCQAYFKGPADTTINEGALVNLSGTADCASGVTWTVLSGPAPRILDPEMKTLAINMPRIAGDTVIVYRFSAVYGDSTHYKDVHVRVKEAIPEPAFTLPAVLAWNGKEAMDFRPVISNLAAIQASQDAVIHWAWTTSGLDADTACLKDGLTLKSTAAEGRLQVSLCLDNSGPAVCKTANITVSRTSGPLSSVLTPAAAGLRAHEKIREFRDASGRLRSGSRANLFGASVLPTP